MSYTTVHKPHVCPPKPSDAPYGTVVRCDDCGQRWIKEGSALLGLVFWTRQGTPNQQITEGQQ